jgi:hypothetical protein
MSAQMLNLLNRMDEILDTPEHWCQKAAALDSDGFEVEVPTSPRAFSFCLMGALSRAEAETKAMNVVGTTLRFYNYFHKAMELPDSMGVVNWNDRPGRTFEEVKAALRKVIELEKTLP